MTITTNNRNGTADLLKGLAVLFMIQVHIMEQFTSHEIYTSFIGKLSLFFGGPSCAPIFLAVMGYFLLSKQKSFWYYFKRGSFLFIGGMFLNVLRSTHLLLFIIGDKVLLPPLFYIFGVDILQLAGLSIIIIGMLQFLFKQHYIGYLILAFLIAIFSNFFPFTTNLSNTSQHIIAFVGGNFAWSYFPLFPWLAYVLMGVAFKLFTNKHTGFLHFTNRKYYLFLLPILIILVATINYGINTAHDLYGVLGYYHHGIKYFVWVLLFLIVYIVFINFMENYFGNNFIMKFIKWNGKNVTVIYVIQWIIIGNIATLIYKTQSILQYFAWFLAITTATCILTLVWTKIIDYRNKKEESII